MKKYTKEEIENVINDLRGVWSNIPASVRIDGATNIPNLRDTLPKMVECVKLNWHKPRMCGYVSLLIKIRNKIFATIK